MRASYEPLACCKQARRLYGSIITASPSHAPHPAPETTHGLSSKIPSGALLLMEGIEHWAIPTPDLGDQVAEAAADHVPREQKRMIDRRPVGFPFHTSGQRPPELELFEDYTEYGSKEDAENTEMSGHYCSKSGLIDLNGLTDITNLASPDGTAQHQDNDPNAAACAKPGIILTPKIVAKQAAPSTCNGTQAPAQTSEGFPDGRPQPALVPWDPLPDLFIHLKPTLPVIPNGCKVVKLVGEGSANAVFQVEPPEDASEEVKKLLQGMKLSIFLVPDCDADSHI